MYYIIIYYNILYIIFPLPSLSVHSTFAICKSNLVSNSFSAASFWNINQSGVKLYE